jgi:hypothetical protein
MHFVYIYIYIYVQEMSLHPPMQQRNLPEYGRPSCNRNMKEKLKYIIWGCKDISCIYINEVHFVG